MRNCTQVQQGRTGALPHVPRGEAHGDGVCFAGGPDGRLVAPAARDVARALAPRGPREPDARAPRLLRERLPRTARVRRAGGARLPRARLAPLLPEPQHKGSLIDFTPLGTRVSLGSSTRTYD